MAKITNEQNIVLFLTAKSIYDGQDYVVPETLDFKNADWTEVLKEIIDQTVVLATFDAASPYKEFIPKETYQKWQSLAFTILKQNAVVLKSQDDLIGLLGDHPYLILKGSSAAINYKKPELRSLGDVDFLIDPKEQDELEKLFIANGYEKSQGEHPNHVVFQKPNANLEMHFEIAGVPFGEQGKKVKEFIKNAVFEPVEATQDFSKFNTPKSEYNALIFLLHMQHHMLGDGFGLRHLCDWACFVNKTLNEKFWEEKLIPLLTEIGLMTYAKVITAVASKYLKCTLPEWATGVEDDLIEQIIIDILTGGNFGVKDKTRAKSAMLISETGKAGTKHGALYNLSHAMHRAVMRQKCVQKFPPLYPIMYVYRSLRFLFLSMIGKRPSLAKMAPEAEKRKAVYDRLEIFVTPKEKEK